MADEALVNRLYDIVNQITKIGGEQEITSITSGILVTNANPTDLPTGYIKIENPRDGTYVPCLTVNGLVVSDNDLVNVLFVKGTEPIAISQSANSPSNSLKVSEIWESDFDAVALQADASGNLTINGTRTLTIPTDLIHAGDTDTKISFTDDDIEFTAGNLSMLKLTEAVQDLITLGPGSGDVDINFNGDMFLQGSDGNLGIGKTGPSEAVEIYRATGNVILVLETGDASFASFQLVNSAGQWNTRISGADYQIREAPPVSKNWFTIESTTGHFGFNRGSPEGQIHAYDSVAGMIKWEYDALDGTSRTVISNAAGDVVYRLTGMYVLRASGGARASGTLDVNNGASTGLVVGGNTVTLVVNADGSVTVSRTAGADTIRVAFILLWL